jgi:DHA1 family multidrug resistance protein-like MFS transporter
MLEGLTDQEKNSLFRASMICVAIFFADASHSLVIPIFPTFAQGLGASLTMIGLYGSMIGIAMVLLSMPIGSISDRVGRRKVLIMGFVLMVTVPLLYIIASSPIHLLFARLLLGVSMGSTFGLGFVWVSEEALGKFRGIAQGLYMTAMGIGFTVGPIVGGYASAFWGFSAAFIASSLLGAFGLFALLLIKGETPQTKIRVKEVKLRETLADPQVLAAGLSNFINTLMYLALSTFFPLYGLVIGLTSAEVGLGFTVRGLFSTIIRFPATAASKGRITFWLLIVGLAAQAITIALLASNLQLNILLILLAIQGAMYGVSLTAGNVYVATEAPPERRGAAMGVYQSFSNASTVVCPLILGGLAELYNVSTPLQVAAVASIAGVALCILLSRRKFETTQGSRAT